MRLTPAIGLTTIFALIVSFFMISSVNAQPLAKEKYVEGEHYQRIAKPVKTANADKIEVTEVFWYGCPHCNQFRPVFESWKKTQKEDVDVQHSPAIWNKPMIMHAHIFYTAKALNLLDKMHKEVFDAMHIQKKRMVSKKQIFALFEKHGVTQEQFDKTFESFGIKSQVKQANSRARQYGITGTPEIIVNGKYRVSGRMVQGGQREVLQVAAFLVEKEREAMTKKKS